MLGKRIECIFMTFLLRSIFIKIQVSCMRGPVISRARHNSESVAIKSTMVAKPAAEYRFVNIR